MPNRREGVQAERYAGDLVANPTDLTGQFPYGGVDLGLVRDKEWRPNVQSRLLVGEELGAHVDAVYAGELAVLAAVMREMNDELLLRLFPHATVGGSGHTVLSSSPGEQGGALPGTLLSGNSLTVVFAPVNEDLHDFIVVYRAMALVEDAAALQLSIGEEAGFAVMFYGIPDDQGRVYQAARREDIVL